MSVIFAKKIYPWNLIPNQSYNKNKASGTGSIRNLIYYSKNTLGYQMGNFLLKNNFGLSEKLKSNHIFYVVTNTGITVPEETSIKFHLPGNEKRSLHLLSVIFLITLLFPDYLKAFLLKYRLDKSALVFR